MQDLDYYTYNQAKDMAPTSPSDLVPLIASADLMEIKMEIEKSCFTAGRSLSTK